MHSRNPVHAANNSVMLRAIRAAANLAVQGQRHAAKRLLVHTRKDAVRIAVWQHFENDTWLREDTCDSSEKKFKKLKILVDFCPDIV